MFGFGLSRLGGAIRSMGGSVPFSPLDLFAAGEQGAWYDPSDLSTMFQDAAGTTPVTADGQPVGLILDKSGRGNHASQATAAARPLYKTDGTYRWLQFDGVDDSLITAAIDFTGIYKMSVFAGLRKIDDSDVKLFAGLGMNTEPGGFSVWQGSPLSGPSPMWATSVQSSGGGGVLNSLSSATFPSPETVVDTALFSIQAPSQTLRINAIQVAQNAVALQPGSFGNLPVKLSQPGGNGTNGNIYSLIVRGALSTPEEITETETWVNGKTGAY